MSEDRGAMGHECADRPRVEMVMGIHDVLDRLTGMSSHFPNHAAPARLRRVDDGRRNLELDGHLFVPPPIRTHRSPASTTRPSRGRRLPSVPRRGWRALAPDRSPRCWRPQCPASCGRDAVPGCPCANADCRGISRCRTSCSSRSDVRG